MYADSHIRYREPELDRQFTCDCCSKQEFSGNAITFELPGGDWLFACPPCEFDAIERHAAAWDAAESMDLLELAFMGNA